jgi:hypothetical protein
MRRSSQASGPPFTAADAVRAIALAVPELRVELGEPSDRTGLTLEHVR